MKIINAFIVVAAIVMLAAQCPECPPHDPTVCDSTIVYDSVNWIDSIVYHHVTIIDTNYIDTCLCEDQEEPITGLEGFGANKGAYETTDSPTILTVTNLNNSGEGSLRWAIDQNYPRVIRFAVGGMIHLNSMLYSVYPYITIEGQTAPTPVTLVDNPFEIRSQYAIVQHLRVVTGPENSSIPIDDKDAVRIYNGANKVVLDHCTIMQGCDGNIDFLGSPAPQNITLQDCIIANAWDGNGYSYDMLISSGVKNVSLIRCLFANSMNRHPLMNDNTSMEMINCVIYNVEKRGVDFNDADVTIKGSIKLNGPNAGFESEYMARARDGNTQQSIYFEDVIADELLYNASGNCVILDKPTTDSGNYTLISSGATLNYLLENAGSFNWDRHADDQNIISQIQ